MPRKAAARRAGSASARRAPVRRWRVFLSRTRGTGKNKGMDLDGPQVFVCIVVFVFRAGTRLERRVEPAGKVV